MSEQKHKTTQDRETWSGPMRETPPDAATMLEREAGSDFPAAYADFPDHEGAVQVISETRSLAMRRRDHIVACVNACEGISPEVVPDLLATARELVRDVHGCELDASMSAAVSACAAAIARAEGGAA